MIEKERNAVTTNRTIIPSAPLVSLTVKKLK